MKAQQDGKGSSKLTTAEEQNALRRTVNKKETSTRLPAIQEVLRKTMRSGAPKLDRTLRFAAVDYETAFVAAKGNEVARHTVAVKATTANIENEQHRKVVTRLLWAAFKATDQRGIERQQKPTKRTRKQLVAPAVATFSPASVPSRKVAALV